MNAMEIAAVYSRVAWLRIRLDELTADGEADSEESKDLGSECDFLCEQLMAADQPYECSARR